MTTQQSQKESPKTLSFTESPLKMASVAGLLGLAFGTALYKSQVFHPDIIRGQMTFENFTMLKAFLSAVATSAGVFTVLESLKLTQITSVAPMWNRNLVGGLILGTGIYLAGSCPGTVYAQIGANFPQGKYVFLGGLLGSLTYGFLDKFVTKTSLFRAKSDRKPTLHETLGVSRATLTIPIIAAIVGGLATLEMFVPWQRDLGLSPSTSIFSAMSFSSPVWSPYFAGLVIGLLQLPGQLLFKISLGASSSFDNYTGSLMTMIPGFSDSSYFMSNTMSGTKNIWQPVLTTGVVLGAMLSNYYAPSPYASIFTEPNLRTIISGFFLVFGARFAGGCTSGHGISGAAKLNIGSLIATVAMFAGGIGAALLTRALV